MEALKRTGLWFGSLLLSVILFSVFLGHLNGAVFVFRITMLFALPVAFLYLPLVIVLRDAEEQRARILLITGILIGPASLAVWGLILQLKGGDPQMVWVGDGLDQGAFSAMFCALIVGSLTTGSYVVALKALHRSWLKQPK